METFFLDTNILVKWIYRKLLNEKEDIERFISSLSKDQCIILDINLSEFESIINDAYNMVSHIIYEKILSRSDWKELDIKGKFQIINDIRKNFDRLYDEIRKTHYNELISPGGIRQILAKEFFKKLEDKVVNLDPEVLRNHIALNGRTEDLIDYLSSVKAIIKQKFTVLDNVKILINDYVIKEIQLIYEGINRHLRNLKSQGYKKVPSRKDQLIFQYLFLLLREGIYDNIVFITDDNDFERMYRAILNYSDDIIKGKVDPRGEFRGHAMEIKNTLGKLVIKNINELISNK
ncbi:hypothetical protein [Saccharolobus solfataricus]|nr:hypothetical protein [Saccharolobus solfataricus]